MAQQGLLPQSLPGEQNTGDGSDLCFRGDPNNRQDTQGGGPRGFGKNLGAS
jgi:hypothetical protein